MDDDNYDDDVPMMVMMMMMMMIMIFYMDDDAYFYNQLQSRMYVYLRWIWVQFPWLALHSARSVGMHVRKIRYENKHKYDVSSSSTTRKDNDYQGGNDR
jgi:hypothetical protein